MTFEELLLQAKEGNVGAREEIFRMYGYDNIPSATIEMPLKPVEQIETHKLEYQIKYALASKFGLNEVHSYVWNYKDFNEEIGIEEENEAKHILIKVQTKASEAIEPAFIVGEDELFLDLFVLSPQGPGITSTAVLKDNIQSIGVIGGVSTEKIDSSEIPDETQLLDDVAGLYQ